MKSKIQTYFQKQMTLSIKLSLACLCLNASETLFSRLELVTGKLPVFLDNKLKIANFVILSNKRFVHFIFKHFLQQLFK